eukprot:CAMPEP_0113961780 /NCGR_PEP_ID=MMETSP0011_2-20120614/5521_1 /TAXON_ID=101924 /ORGANISM="Rhodosorus marinus" /LENGTH=273 /DNA_ID=CAMNT_0000973503 /DNA_START=231 /DNA_END=1052 /DNA_ORIENTATION=+ /assembly_acc=CAM_ASM_000156
MTQEEIRRDQWDSMKTILPGSWLGRYWKQGFKDGKLDEPVDIGELHYIVSLPDDDPDSCRWEGRKMADKKKQGQILHYSYEKFESKLGSMFILPGVLGQNWFDTKSPGGGVEINFISTDYCRRMMIATYERTDDGQTQKLKSFLVGAFRDSTVPEKVPVIESLTAIDRIREIPSLEPVASLGLSIRGGEKKYYDLTDEEAHCTEMLNPNMKILPLRDSMFACVPEVVGGNSSLFFGVIMPSSAQIAGVRLDSNGVQCEWFTSIYGNHNGRPKA